MLSVHCIHPVIFICFFFFYPSCHVERCGTPWICDRILHNLHAQLPDFQPPIRKITWKHYNKERWAACQDVREFLYLHRYVHVSVEAKGCKFNSFYLHSAQGFFSLSFLSLIILQNYIMSEKKGRVYIYTHTHTKTCTSYSMRLSFYPCWILSAGSRISPIQFILSFTLTESFTPTLISVSFNSPPYLHLSNLHLSPFSHDTTLELKTTLLTTPKNQPKTQWRQRGL